MPESGWYESGELASAAAGLLPGRHVLLEVDSDEFGRIPREIIIALNVIAVLGFLGLILVGGEFGTLAGDFPRRLFARSALVRSLIIALVHGALEAFDGAAEVAADIGELFRAEDQDDHQQNDEQLPDADSF
jgi:hypothetical protein